MNGFEVLKTSLFPSSKPLLTQADLSLLKVDVDATQGMSHDEVLYNIIVVEIELFASLLTCSIGNHQLMGRSYTQSQGISSLHYTKSNKIYHCVLWTHAMML